MRKVLGAAAKVVYLAVIVVPILWVVSTSLKSNQEILDSATRLPSALRFDNFARAWSAQNIGSAMSLSLVATVCSLAVLLPVGSMAAYALARYRFKLASPLLGVFTAGLMFPNLLAAVPLFILSTNLKMDDTLHGLVSAYVAYSLAFTVFVLHGFFSVLPRELAEAAEIDGCGHWATFLRVMLPLARPGIVVVGIFNAIGLWNEYNLAKVLMLSRKTLPVTLSDLVSQQQYAGDWGALYAGAVIVMLPVLLAYWFLKDRIQQAMLAGAIK